MAVAMIGPKFYAWDKNGLPLAFGKLYTYQTQTNTPKDTFTDEGGSVANTNPVILNGEGYADVYLSGSYKMVLKDLDDNEIWSSDPVTSLVAEEWVNCLAATYVNPSSFEVANNQTDTYDVGRSVRLDLGGPYVYATIDTSIFSGGKTTVTISESVATPDLVSTCVSIVGIQSLSQLRFFDSRFPVLFNTVADMVLLNPIAGDQADPSSGDLIATRSHTDTFGAGTYARDGRAYLVQTLDEARAAKNDVTWEPDEERDFTLDNTLIAIQVDTERDSNRSANRTFSHIQNLAHAWQFGGTQEHYLSKNAVIINGDSVTQGANAGYYMDNGYAYKLKRELMEWYKTKSYGYLSVDDKDGFITAPSGAYRWYEPSTNGTLRQNQDAPNSIGGTEVELAGGQFVKFEFNRQDKYSREIIPNQKKYRIAWNDSTGSVRVTANGIGSSIDEVIATSVEGISTVLSLPNSWDGTITITQESGTPVINGIVLMASEDDYCVHMIYNGGRSHIEIADEIYGKLINNSDIYIHALGINDAFGETSPAQLAPKIDVVIEALNASRSTKAIVLDLIWTQKPYHFARAELKRLARSVDNENKLLEIPRLIANGETEYTTAELASDEIKFLASDQVHPFLNGHTFICNTILAELGMDQNLQTILSSEVRQALIGQYNTKSYNFGDADLSQLIIGWNSDGNNSLVYTEGAGTVATGFIWPAYIETMIPISNGNRYIITFDIENVDSTGTLSLGTRSLDAIGNEIYEQDATGGLSGNMPFNNIVMAASERRVFKFSVGGRNEAIDSDPAKFEPGAAFFNLAMVFNNTSPIGESIIIHGISVIVAESNTIAHDLTDDLENSWVKEQPYLSVHKDVSTGYCTLFGTVENGGSGVNLLTLPEEFRPDTGFGTQYFYGPDDNTGGVDAGLIKILVNSSGGVQIFGSEAAGWNARVPLTGITYATKAI